MINETAHPHVLTALRDSDGIPAYTPKLHLAHLNGLMERLEGEKVGQQMNKMFRNLGPGVG